MWAKSSPHWLEAALATELNCQQRYWIHLLTRRRARRKSPKTPSVIESLICKWSAPLITSTKPAPSTGLSFFLQNANVTGGLPERKYGRTKAQSPNVHPHQLSTTNIKKTVAATCPPTVEMTEAASSAEVGVAQVRGCGPQLSHQGMPSASGRSISRPSARKDSS
jgi:hypothetical protein